LKVFTLYISLFFYYNGGMIRDYNLTLKNDYLFKRLLGVEENKSILQDFIEAVLNISHKDIEEIELLDKELKKDKSIDKTGILDVKVRLENKTIINIEIQNIWDDSFINRTLFYWAKIYIEEFRQGEDYTRLHKCITINIVGKGFELSDKIHSKYILKEEDSNKKLTDMIEMHFLNLEKAKEIKNIDDYLVRWLLFIDTDSKEERNMLAKNSPILKILNEKINVLNLNPTERKLYESRMKLKSDILSISNSQFRKGIEQGREEGREEGREKGREEGSYAKAVETARECLILKMEIETISRITGLTKEEIKNLQI
ncbi:MAG: Rpn family recombination-promoting nuclease/putative transposase, partial [Treponema sp.]